MEKITITVKCDHCGHVDTRRVPYDKIGRYKCAECGGYNSIRIEQKVTALFEMVTSLKADLENLERKIFWGGEI